MNWRRRIFRGVHWQAAVYFYPRILGLVCQVMLDPGFCVNFQVGPFSLGIWRERFPQEGQ